MLMVVLRTNSGNQAGILMIVFADETGPAKQGQQRRALPSTYRRVGRLVN